MAIMRRIHPVALKHAVLAAALLAAPTGCSAGSGDENRRRQDEYRLILESQNRINYEQQIHECILRHNAARDSCELSFYGETNAQMFQNKVVRCMIAKRYANGLATCG
jgi:hypothetical protein